MTMAILPSTTRRPALSGPPVWLFGPPFGTIHVPYQRGTADCGQRPDQGHTLFLKATTVF